MTTRTLRVSIAAVLLVVIAAAAGGWWYMAAGRMPLRGTQSHDFGLVKLAGATVTLEHVFELENRGDETVRIEAIRSSCGCVTADASMREIAPGATVDVTVRLTVLRPGISRQRVKLVIEDFGVQSLFVEAKGL